MIWNLSLCPPTNGNQIHQIHERGGRRFTPLFFLPALNSRRVVLDFRSPRLIGVIHLKPLPGSPGYSGPMAAVLEAAAADATAWREGGADAVLIENFGDIPFARTRVDPETVAAMAWAARVVREELGVEIPMGFNVLRNDARAALGLCAACGGSFLRVNVLTGTAVTDQGVIEGDAFRLTRERDRIAPEVKILADIHVKHARPLGGGSLADAARDTGGRGGADALILTGSATGSPVRPDDLATVREAAPGSPVLLGSGTDPESLRSLRDQLAGAIVGTWAKREARIDQPVDPARVRELVQALCG